MIIHTPLDFDHLVTSGHPLTERHLNDLQGCFADHRAYAQALVQGNPLIYSMVSVEPARGDGQLHYGLARLMPGRVGTEYYMTKGHVHAWREAAEVYIGLAGTGVMLLEDERTGDAATAPLVANSVVYVPGYVAHRTVNTGNEPLVYLGVYPAEAGHEYLISAGRNFRRAVVAIDGRATLIDRSAYAESLSRP